MPKTVMIVEDNELNMKLFNDLLRANGYGTLPMRNGHEALDALKSVAATEDNLLPASVEAAKAGATTGEWADALREHFDLGAEYRLPRRNG